MKTPISRLCMLAACLQFFNLPATSAADLEIHFQEPLRGQLTPDAPVSLSIQVNNQDFSELSIRLIDAPGIARIFDGTGRLVRGSNIDIVGGLSFAAPATGSYRFELTADKPTTYRVIWTRRVPLEERLSSRVHSPAVGGPRIEALRKAVAAGTPGAVPAFWAEVESKGTPLVEPLADDTGHMLVTFLWKGNAGTRKVLLLWPAQNRTAPAACAFSRVAETDVWYATLPVNKAKRALYRLVENGPDLPDAAGAGAANDAMGMIWGMSQSDPLNPRPLEYLENKADPPGFQGSSTLEMPDAPAQALLSRRAGIPAGKISVLRVGSTLLKNERKITVYTPPGFSPSAARYGAIYLMDGDDYIERMHLDVLLDNLLAEHRIPPLVAVLVNNPPNARGDLAAAAFPDFMSRELAPLIRRAYNVTDDPRRIIIGGKSLGGYAAAEVAYCFPDVFGNVLSQSAPLYSVEREFASTVCLPIRLYLSVGLDETDRGGLLAMNRTMHKTLQKKGYEVYYEEVDGGHDLMNWRITLPNGLLLLSKPALAPAAQ